MVTRTAATVIGLVLLTAYIAGSGFLVQASGGWYSSLVRPVWQPPDWVFGLIWPYNFVVLGIAMVAVPRRLQPARLWLWLLVFAVSVASALGWSYLFYVPHHLVAASACLLLAALATVPLVSMAWQTNRQIGMALLPYQLWLFIATTLSAAYAARN